MGSARELWSHDRIHGSAEGHRRVADGMARLLGLPDVDDTWSLVSPTRLGPVGLASGEAAWLASFLGPWLARQVRGRGARTSSGPVCKRPDLLPVTGCYSR